MAYSDRQLRRIRDSVLAYYTYRKAESREPWGWGQLAYDIEHETGVDVPYERLRQFVKGSSKKKGEKSGLKKENLDAVVKFVTDQSRNLLSVDELNERAPQMQAPLRLIEYLAPAFEPERKSIPNGLIGTYIAHKLDDVEFVVVEMILQHPLDNGVIQVLQTEEYYPVSFSEKYDVLSIHERKKARRAKMRYSGWAIITPEDNLLFFMKKQESKRNHYLFTIAFDFDSSDDGAICTIILLHHDYPLEPESKDISAQDMKADIMRDLGNNLLFMNRLQG